MGIDRPKIQILFELSFQDSAIQEVLLIKNRHLIVERYALGEDENSSDPSWGMTKSLYAALIEISIDRDEIDRLDDPVVRYLDYFHNEPRHIRVRDLLDMTSGLDFPAHEY
jgi:CubicO group peptidase (beta-lactamase class C family)